MQLLTVAGPSEKIVPPKMIFDIKFVLLSVKEPECVSVELPDGAASKPLQVM